MSTDKYTPHTSTRYSRTDQNKSDKPLPKLYAARENCCGCSACAMSCPVQAIRMTPDAEGFRYPEIDASVCIRCGKCLKACAFKPDQRQKGLLSDQEPDPASAEPAQPDVYAVKHSDEAVRAASRSGGIFTALSDAVLAAQGTVYGCALTEDFRAVHIRAESAADRNRMRGSKYVQSDMQDIYTQVKADLEQGRKVLFSGTSCQVAGLHRFLSKTYDNLLCVDIVCHGVPSPLVWEKYLSWQETQQGARTKTVDFRNKRDFGWRAHVETLYMQNGKKTDSEIYRNLFYSHLILRPSCYQCPYKSTVHPGDITIADYWGIDQAAPGFSDNKGVSLVLVNTENGRQYFEQVQAALTVRKTKLEDSMQPPLKAPFPAPANRTQFWEDFYQLSFAETVRKYGQKPFLKRVRSYLARMKQKILK